MEKIRFDGRAAVVTGAGRGIGRTYALELARLGARVVVNDLGCAIDGTGASPEVADVVCADIVEAGGTAVPNYDTVATLEGGRNIVQTALDHFGRIDILINNAMINRDSSFYKMAPDVWQDVLDVGLQGAYNVTRPAFEVMQGQKYGRIIFTISPVAVIGHFGQANYGAAKMGLVGLLKTLSLEGQEVNIKVNAVAPIALTRMTEQIMPPTIAEQVKPELVAPLVLYLCSEDCPASGEAYNAVGGYYGRLAIVNGPGIFLRKGVRVPTIESIRDNWDSIQSLDNPWQYDTIITALDTMLSGSPLGQE